MVLSPWQEFGEMQNRIRQMLGESWGLLPDDGERWMPVVEVSDANGEIVVTAELPGVMDKDIDVHLSNGMLTIRGEKKQETKEEDHEHYLLERYYGVFSRCLTLPAEVDEEKVSAEFKNGVLKITLPKKVPATPHKIPITS